MRPVWDSPDLEVCGTWRTEPAPADESPFPNEGGEEGFGKRMRLSEDELVWFDTHRDKDLQLRFPLDIEQGCRPAPVPSSGG